MKFLNKYYQDVIHAVKTLDAKKIDSICELIKKTSKKKGTIYIAGNGGSASIASHMAIDFSKNGGIPALAFNDPASLTCLANDLSFENVFSHQVKMLGQSQDMLFAISSSGRSQNILNAVTEARAIGIGVLTFSGFEEDNPLRSMGDMNLYLSSHTYGFVEIGHLTLCHAILDISMGWRPEKK